MTVIKLGNDFDAQVPGVLLTEPKIRGFVTAQPSGSRSALRVRVFTELGSEICNLRAVETERTIVEIPRPPGSTPPLERAPGSLWFYGINGEAIGFLPDHTRATLARPGAVEKAPTGPTTPRTIKSLQESLRLVLGGLENLTSYLESRARRFGHRDLAASVSGDVRALVTWTAVTLGPIHGVIFARTGVEALERILAAGKTSPLANEDSRAAALRFEPVAELARKVLERELDKARSISV